MSLNELPPLVQVDEKIKKKRRWVNDYVDTLDPDTEYDRIMAVTSMYQQDEHSLHMFIASSSVHVVMPAHGAEAVLFTNNFVRRPNLRNQNTLSFFWTWFSHGPHHPESIAATKRLNAIHQRVADQLPGHFDIDSDFVYTLALFTVIQNRLLKRLGMPEQSPKMKKAIYNFMEGISQHIRKGGDLPITGYPKSFEECEAFVEDWERWPHRYSKPQQDLILAFMDQYVAKNYPGPLEFLGNWIILYTIPDHILEHYRIKPLRGFKRWATRNLLRALLTYNNKFKADAKVPFLERREVLNREELLRLDKNSIARADKNGWTRGGASSLYVTEGAGDISMCPVMSTRTPEELAQVPVRKKHGKIEQDGRVEYDTFKETA